MIGPRVHEHIGEPSVERKQAPARAAAPSSTDVMGTPAAVIALQRSAGNRAVAAAIRSGHIRPLARCTCGVGDQRRLMREESDADRPGEAPGTLSEPADLGQPVAQPLPDAAAPGEPTTNPC